MAGGTTGGGSTTGGKGGANAAPATGNIFEQSSAAYGGGLGALGAGAGMLGTAGPISAGMSNYYNPFNDAVRDTTLADIDRQRQMAINQDAGAAASAGAFGGSRHGVADALTNEAAMRQAATSSAALNSQNFNTAAQLSGQDVSNQLAAGSALGGLGAQAGQFAQTGLGMGQAINNQTGENGALLRGLSEALIGQSAGMFDRYVNQPTDTLQLRLAALGANPGSQTGTQTSTSSTSPGAMDIIGGFAKGLGTLALK